MGDSSGNKDSQFISESMRRLHAYWRMPYIVGPKNQEESGNPFTKIHKSGDDRSQYILLRGEFNYIVMNRYPYNAGHLLVVPYREVPRLDEMGV